jgi:tetratricopeptide (TPR) repeat protein
VLDLAMLGAFDEAAAIVAERMRSSQERSDIGVNLRIVSASCVGVHHVARGDLDGALAVLEPTAELSRRSASVLQFTRGAAALACAYVLADRAPDAVAVLEPVLAEVGRTSYAYLAEELECALGTAYLYAGHSADADRLLREALRRARASGARGLEAEVLRAMGDATSRGRDPDLQLAARYVREAQALADRLGMRPLGARCRVELARVRRGQGRMEESAGLLGRAIAEFRDMGMAFWLRRAEADLAHRG